MNNDIGKLTTVSLLALRPRQAAKALGIGERKLWELTNMGEIPHFRVGRSVLYSVDALREWVSEQVAGGGQ